MNEEIKQEIELTAMEQQKKVIGTPFVKGQSGNPAGRPKGSGLSITRAIREKLHEIRKFKTKDGIVEKQTIEAILERIIKMATDGDWRAIEKIWAYVDGQPRASLNIEADITETITSNISIDWVISLIKDPSDRKRINMIILKERFGDRMPYKVV